MNHPCSANAPNTLTHKIAVELIIHVRLKRSRLRASISIPKTLIMPTNLSHDEIEISCRKSNPIRKHCQPRQQRCQGCLIRQFHGRHPEIHMRMACGFSPFSFIVSDHPWLQRANARPDCCQSPIGRCHIRDHLGTMSDTVIYILAQRAILFF